jgi:hypothetical protein
LGPQHGAAVVVAVLRAFALIALASASAAADDPKSTPSSERGTTSAPITTEEEGAPKLSLATEVDRVAWQKTGFRLGLALAYGRFDGIHGAPSGRLLGAVLHAGLRLDPQWSLMSTFQYASAYERHGLNGLRFAGTIDPTWHPSPSFALALGVGFGGIVEGRTGRVDMTPMDLSTDVSYTYPSPTPSLTSCSGVGAAGLARAEWMYVLGPRSATTVALEVLGQYTACVQKIGLEPDTARPIERRQYWPHAGFTLSWGVTWR